MPQDLSTSTLSVPLTLRFTTQTAAVRLRALLTISCSVCCNGAMPLLVSIESCSGLPTTSGNRWAIFARNGFRPTKAWRAQPCRCFHHPAKPRQPTDIAVQLLLVGADTFLLRTVGAAHMPGKPFGCSGLGEFSSGSSRRPARHRTRRACRGLCGFPEPPGGAARI